MSASAVGQLIDDKYELVGIVGRGGMSVVWLARDIRLEKMWAIKEVRPGEDGGRGAILRKAIVDEANFMKRLDHPAIPRVVDIIDTGSTLYVVMDYVNGRPLNRVLAQREAPFEQAEVILWGIQLCDVLGYLHSFVTPEGERHAIIYRDMKPSNVILREDNQVRLIDFGVCWERVDDAPNDGMVVGTPGYAAPEQMTLVTKDAGRELDAVVDCRSDIYALGATLYSLVTGHVPKMVTRKDGTRHVSFDMRPIRSWNPELSEGLEAILAKATQEDPRLRYASMAEMSYDLQHYQELTQEYRERQERKVLRFRRRAQASAALCACAILLVALGAMLRDSNFADFMRAASVASKASADGRAPSEAERLYTQAIESDPTRVEPYRALITEVYEDDGVFSRFEEERWNAIFRAHEKDLASSDGYASLCYDTGVCYLCFYGIEASNEAGVAVGQGAIANAAHARPWFERVKASCDVREAADSGSEGSVAFNKGAQTIDDADLLAAAVYVHIAEFNDLKQRAAREGRAAGETYEVFWDALQRAVDMSSSYTEGVRLRLYQIAFEAIAADDVLDGIYRKALEDGRVDESRREVEGLLDVVLRDVRADDLRGFCMAPSNSGVYGPIYQQIDGNEAVARNNVAFVYQNPVARVDGIALKAEGEEQ